MVSVVIPTFNRLDLLGITIDSIISQSFRDFEIIIIDDGSTDGTRERFESDYHPQIRYAYQANGGESSATNHGWRLAQGRYVAIVSSDDPVLPGWMEMMVGFMDANPSALVGYPDWRIINADGQLVQQLKTEAFALKNMVAWLLTMPGPGSFIRKEALQDFGDLRNPKFRYAPDLETWLRLALVGNFARVPHELACWRSHPTSITVADRSLARARELPNLVRHFFARGDIPKSIRPLKPFALGRAYWNAAWIVLDSHPVISDYYLLKSYWVSPEDPPDLPPYLKRFARPHLSHVWKKIRLSLVSGR